MSKVAVSYFDWEQTFKGKSLISNKLYIAKSKNINSLGIKDNEFKDFLKKWKENNIP